ncbi:MAG: hypothetical protein WDA26_13585 [Pusillimonas sp.]
MDEEQKKLLTIGVIAILLVLAMFLMCSKSPNKDKTTSPKTTKTSKATESKNTHGLQAEDPFVDTYQSGSSYVPSNNSYTVTNSYAASFETSRYPSRIGNKGPLVKLAKGELESIRKFRENAKKEQKDIIKAKIQKILNDPNADPALKAHCQVGSSEAYRVATVARKNKDFKKAIKSYHEMLKDKKSTPVMQYFALDGIKRCAQETQDLQLYILAIKQLGELMAKEDLSVINEEKSDSYLKWALKFEKYMMAKRDPAYMQSLIDEHMNRYKRSRSGAEKRINTEIAELESFYKEFAYQ